MSQNKLHIYIASTLLANILISVGLSPAADAKPRETIKSENYVEKLALNTSSQSDADVSCHQGNSAKIDFTHLNQFLTHNTDLTTTKTTNIVERALMQNFDNISIGNENKVLNSSELDLDSILANEFEAEGVILISRCCT
ncbi:hypothetical protein [Nodularia sp. NIES-3585]|uniref:hypothetical protein n=1 Tax=Nodularia sp. NIES-3585 TaxID=1973477 RepID=UPI000B5C2E5F|nr:hypothetical protein [Nodularia sp. NIES-3585]GAX38292.1 hypothetical protein NIES3585_43410 [Nodularia sp. NIES-3585]